MHDDVSGKTAEAPIFSSSISRFAKYLIMHMGCFNKMTVIKGNTFLNNSFIMVECLILHPAE